MDSGAWLSANTLAARIMLPGYPRTNTCAHYRSGSLDGLSDTELISLQGQLMELHEEYQQRLAVQQRNDVLTTPGN